MAPATCITVVSRLAMANPVASAMIFNLPDAAWDMIDLRSPANRTQHVRIKTLVQSDALRPLKSDWNRPLIARVGP
ncbi:hypothetical protein GCM10022254_11620 [Actinomadura meridiana]|uniref:Uncharacterized protein n=1 Tax=Actinomadura meridiana TaxID=559626 RepID=A0ABP8BUB0_9ACTN